MAYLLKKRLWITATAMLISVACGIGLGYLTSTAISLHGAATRLQQYAARLLENDVASSKEARDVFRKMNSSPYPHCSDAELHYFRDLLFASEYLKDVGSILGDKIDCSANMGKLAVPLALPQPKFVQHDGMKVYQSLSPPGLADIQGIGMQFGGSYVVFNGYNFTRMALPPMHFISSESDAANKQLGPLIGDSSRTHGMMLTQDYDGRIGNSLYATRCYVAYSDCVTAYLLIPDALQADRSSIAAFVFLGGLVGVFFGLFCSDAYLRSRSMERQLRRSISKDELKMVYQPIVELVSGRIVGAETLARWTDEEGTPIAPDVFIQLAEERGFVESITRLVVHRALNDFAATLRRLPAFRISVNVAAADLADPDFLPMLDDALKQAQVEPASLTIEITESSTAHHNVAIETILALRRRGHSVHIDDFGTGFSSLSYLHDMAVDAIKIDRSFTKSVGTDAANAAILPKILSMAEALSLKVVVEGIETESQAAFFVGKGHQILGQGWLFGRPVAAEEFKRQMADNEQKPPSSSATAWQSKALDEDETLISAGTA